MNSIFDAIQADVDSIQDIPSIAMASARVNRNVDIYEFFNVLLELFTKLNMISTSPDDYDTKIEFYYAYPDKVYAQNTTVAYDVLSRKPLVTNSKSSQNGPTTHLKPQLLGESLNRITGNMEETYAARFENVISLRCFSDSATTLLNTTRLIESLMIKYYTYLKRYINESVFIGQGSTQFHGNYDNKRLFSRELQFKIITSETFVVEIEQLKSVHIQTK